MIEGVGGILPTKDDMGDGGTAFIRPLVFIAALLLTGCGHQPAPIIRTVTVIKPVAVACVPANLDPAGSYPDTDEALRSAVDAAERYALVAAGRMLRDARLGELEPIIQACREGVAK